MSFLDKIGNFFEDAGEFVVDTFTGGVSREARESLDSVEDAMEKAAIAMGLIAATVEKLGEDLDSLIKKQITPMMEDAGDLLSIERLTPRDESELFEDEKERLADLREKKDTLTSEISALRDDIKNTTGVEIPEVYGLSLEVWILQKIYTRGWFGGFNWDLFGLPSGGDNQWDQLGKPGRENVRKMRRMNSEYIKIENEIHAMLYNEPGPVPVAVYNTKNILERFNTIEQPKIEDVVDSIDDNLVETKEIAEQVKKLFVIKNKIAIAEAELPSDKLELLESLKKEYEILEGALKVDKEMAVQLMELKTSVQPAYLNLVESNVRPLFDVDISLKKDLEESKLSSGIKDAFTKKNVPLSGSVKVLAEGNNSWRIIGEDKKEYTVAESGNRLEVYAKTEALPAISKTLPGVRVSGGPASKYDQYNNKYALQKAVVDLQERDLGKLKRKIDQVTFRETEEPGVIPRMLEKSESILERVNTEEQPRVEAILDSVNENLTESKNAIKNVNISLERANGFIDRHARILKIGLGVIGVGAALTFVLIPVLLIRMIVWGL